MSVIYYLEGRGGIWLYHFIVYMLGGIYNIENNYYPRGHDDTVKYKGKYELSTEFKGEYPINVAIDGLQKGEPCLNDWQRDICNYLSDKIKIIDTIPENSKVVSIYGSTVVNNYMCDEPTIYFPYLRSLFLKNNELSLVKNKRVFLSREKSGQFHNNVLKRNVLNQKDVCKMLGKYNFICINLEDFNIKEKIELFQTSELIVSSHSGGLVMSLFANLKTKIIEICNKGSDNLGNEHYSNICKHMKIEYYRYSDICEDHNGNFNLDVDKLESYLLEFL